ncbi:MAG: SIS domain-containing protein [Acutalibacteraceae bacterium]
MKNLNLWQDTIEKHIKVFDDIQRDEGLAAQVSVAAEKIANAAKNKNTIVFFGNGGSAADAQHIAAEFVGKFMIERAALNVMALTTNTSILTAIANDIDYNLVFARQVSAIIKPGDVAVGITTSGFSKNVILGLEEAKAHGAVTIAMTGKEFSDDLADIIISVPSSSTPNIQEAHIMIGHYFADYTEKKLFEN